MLVLLVPLVLAAAAPAEPLPPRHVTLGLRSIALADGWDLVPDPSHAGGGFGAFAGLTIFDWMELRGGLDLRRLDEGLGFCLEKCGYPGVDPPVRALRQQQLVPVLDVRLRVLDLGPVGVVVGMSELFPIGTSLDGRDPVTLGVVHGFLGGVTVALRDGWSFDTSARWETGMHFVPDAPVAGHSSTFVVDAAFVYRFPEALDGA